MTRAKFAMVCVLVCAVGGCKALLKKREQLTTEASATAAAPSVPAPVVAPPPAAVASAAPAPAESDDGVPTSQDFEDEAFEKVTAANFKAELQRLKKEIEKK
ncbi:MAG: hypothetical protein ACOY0T_21940 [Myxococcota bacterium]